MAAPKFVKVGDIGTLQAKMTAPVVVGDMRQTMENVSRGRESAEQELRRIVTEAQRKNLEWSTERLAEMRKSPQLPLGSYLDTMLVREDGRVEALWPSFLSYMNYPNVPVPPKINELLGMVQQKGMLLYPLMSRRNTWVFCKAEQFPVVHDIAGGDVEFFPYGSVPPEFFLAFIPKGKLVPSKARENGFVLGALGLWSISEFYIDMDHGDKDKVVAYKPRVYGLQGRHPAGNFYITPNPRAVSIATGHLPMDERAGIMRVETDASEHDVIKGMFRGYEKDPRLNSVPLVLRHLPYTPWTGFYPTHGGSGTSPTLLRP